VSRDRFDRAAIALGGGAVLSLVFALTTSSNNNLVKVQGFALVIFPLFGLVAILGGATGRRPVVVIAGVLFVSSAVLQLVQFGRSTNWIAGNGSTNDLDTSAEPTALANNATTIGDFVNSGGGLISHGSEYGWVTGLFPGASSVFSGASGDLVLTPQGLAAFPGLTNADVNAGPWHSHFEGNLGGLATLVRSNTVNDKTGADARVIVGGVGVVLPGSITLEPPTAVRLVGTSHTVTATVRNDQGQLQAGTTVTFTVISGPNQGDTGTGVTGANGQTTFTWPGNSGPGTDTVRASFVDAGGTTRTATATLDWAVAPPISILPVEGVPVVLAATAGVAIFWIRRQRRLGNSLVP